MCIYYVYRRMCLCIRTHTRRSTQWASTILVYCIIFLGCPPLGLQQPRLAERRRKTMRDSICVVHTWFTRNQTTDVSSDTVCVCVCHSIPRGHCSGVSVDRERALLPRESRKHKKVTIMRRVPTWAYNIVICKQ